MSEYEIKCTAIPTDRLVASIDGGDVYLQAHEGSDFKVSVFAKPAEARTFARGILALCDEIDGGEVAPEPLKVGDRVRITHDDFPRFVGKTGELTAIDIGDTLYAYCVKADGERLPVWVLEVERVDDEPSDSRPKVGDRLRVTQDNTWAAPAKPGDIITVVETDYDTDEGEDCVRFLVDGDTYRYYIPLSVTEGPLADWEVDLLTLDRASEPTPEPARSPFAHYVDEARTLLADTVHTGADVIELARELADRA